MKNNIESRLDASRRTAAGSALRAAIGTYILAYVEADEWLFGFAAAGWEAMARNTPSNYPSTATDDLQRQIYEALGEVMRRNSGPKAHAKRQADADKDEADLLSDLGAKTAGDQPC